MSAPDFTLKLARLLVVAAWTDGEVQPSEFAALRRLIEHLPAIGGSDWVELNELMERPIDPERTEAIVNELVEAVTSRRERQAVMDALGEMVAADGAASEEEAQLMIKIGEAIDNKGNRLLNRLARWIRPILQG